jgi:hypothetical protein
MLNFISFFIALGCMILTVSSECANGCNGHGKCTSYDMCICNRNWQANDCSERVCQFGLAHVDTPKGDLDMSGSLSGPNNQIVDNSFTYPYGTTEQFPQMEDSDLNVLTDSGHYYMECSNKGTCDRTSGTCVCYDGYDGVACQRASCPGFPASCSGHGVCKSKKQLADADNGNVYKLWDKDVGMGCHCDSGYYGADCSQRKCKSGIDPLYLDDSATIKYSIFDFALLTTAATIDFNDGGNAIPGTPLPTGQTNPGYWAIWFYDVTGEDWLTVPIQSGSSCKQVIKALEAIPNDVIPPGTTQCTRTQKIATPENRWQSWDAQHYRGNTTNPYRISYNMSIWEADWGENANTGAPELLSTTASSNNNIGTGTKATTALSGYIYRIKFYGNPGYLRQPKIEVYLDGKRPTLKSAGRVITTVWTDGQQGESKDYFGDHCDGVTVSIGYTAYGAYYLTGMSGTEKALLKNCLGASDFDSSNNRETYNWDYGNYYYPHIIKLVRSSTVYNDGGYFAVIYYKIETALDNTPAPNTNQGAQGTFRLLNPFSPPDAFATDNYEVYTTKGTLALTSNVSEATFSFASNKIYMVNASYDQVNAPYDGDISCEVGNNNAYKFKYIFHCLNKTDLFTFLSWSSPEVNPPYINLYTATRLYTTPFYYNVVDKFPSTPVGNSGDELHAMTHIITTDLATNWGASLQGWQSFQIYKFFPAPASTYTYVAECSNRGICDDATGSCTCFPGYTSDDCSVQNAMSL